MAQVPANYIKDKIVDFEGEIFACMGLPLKIAGIRVPQPTIGVFSLLECIDSPFVKDFKESTTMDFLRALYICVKRKEAAEDVKEWVCLNGKESYEEMDPTTWIAFDKAVADFAGPILPNLNYLDKEIFYTFLIANAFTGYEMIPESGSSSGVWYFGADTIAGIIRMTGPSAGMNVDAILWEYPMTLAGHITAIEAKINGTKGIARPKDYEDIILQQRLANEREDRGELHPWQITRPDIFPLTEKQKTARPEIAEDFNKAAKTYLRKKRESGKEKKDSK